jgi:hypothetical protein
MTDLNPSEVLSDQPHAPTREQTQKTVMDKYPGHISWATDRANFAGCRAISFGTGTWSGLEGKDEDKFLEQVTDMTLKWYTQFEKETEKEANGDEYAASPEELLNLYFSTRANLLIVQMGYVDGEIKCLITTQLDDEDLEDFKEMQEVAQVQMRASRERRAEERKKVMADERETQRLAEVGRKYEANLKHNLPKETA